jgi:hypothetical protein
LEKCNEYDNKLWNLINQAKFYLNDNQQSKAGRMTYVWLAYISIEYSILDLKVRYNIEESSHTSIMKIKNRKIFKNKRLREIDYLEVIKSQLEKIDFRDKKKLLPTLRFCRDLLKISMVKSS